MHAWSLTASPGWGCVFSIYGKSVVRHKGGLACFRTGLIPAILPYLDSLVKQKFRAPLLTASTV